MSYLLTEASQSKSSIVFPVSPPLPSPWEPDPDPDLPNGQKGTETLNLLPITLSPDAADAPVSEPLPPSSPDPATPVALLCPPSSSIGNWCRQTGQELCNSSQGRMQSLWNKCLHGSCLATVPGSKLSMHTEHWTAKVESVFKWSCVIFTSGKAATADFAAGGEPYLWQVNR